MVSLVMRARHNHRGRFKLIVVILVTILFFLAVALLHGPPSEEDLCVDEGGVLQEEKSGGKSVLSCVPQRADLSVYLGECCIGGVSIVGSRNSLV